VDIAIDAAEFQGRRLMVRTASWFRGPRLVVDGSEVKGKRGRFILRDNQGQEVTVRLISNHIDPIPKVTVGNRSIELARPLEWYEYVWMGLPILLVFHGGALGAVCGVVAIQSSAQVFRGEGGKARKFLLSGLISVGALLGYFVLLVIFFSLVQGRNP